jgi:ankyrin repeat protein
MACFKNAEGCFITLFEYAKRRAAQADDIKKDRLKLWADVQNCEGFTALHFASFHGNYKMLYPLVETAGADMNILNK